MRPVLALLALTLSCSTLPAQTAPEETAAEVRETLDQQVQAWNQKDLGGFMSGYWNSPALTFFSGGKVNKGWQSALDHYRKSYQSDGREMGKLAFSDLQIEVFGADSAFVRGGWQLAMSGGKTPHGLFTLIFRKFPDGWRIVHDHSCGGE